jgi:methylmalonyl-CoA/ethylmalonyl-CoA epimerase
MILGLHQIAVGCIDLARSVEFYENLLGSECRRVFDPPGLAFFDLGATRLLLERSDSVGPGSSVFYLLVPDLESRCDALRSQGVSFDAEPHLIHRDADGAFGDPGTEEWMAFLRDPDGNSLALVERRASGASNGGS